MELTDEMIKKKKMIFKTQSVSRISNSAISIEYHMSKEFIEDVINQAESRDAWIYLIGKAFVESIKEAKGSLEEKGIY